MKGLKELTDAVADYENNSGSSDQDGQSNDSEEVIFQKIYYKKSHRKSWKRKRSPLKSPSRSLSRSPERAHKLKSKGSTIRDTQMPASIMWQFIVTIDQSLYRKDRNAECNEPIFQGAPNLAPLLHVPRPSKEDLEASVRPFSAHPREVKNFSLIVFLM